MLSITEGRQVDDHTDNLNLARQAYTAHDWATAASCFDAVTADLLTADDLAAYADAVWWLGRVEDNLRLNAAACDAFLADARPADAAWVALILGIFHLARGDEPQGAGWIGRAARLLEGTPEGPAHGYLLLLTEVETNLQAWRLAAAVDAARRMQDLGRRLDQPDLIALALNGEGRAWLARFPPELIADSRSRVMRPASLPGPTGAHNNPDCRGINRRRWGEASARCAHVRQSGLMWDGRQELTVAAVPFGPN